MDFNRYPFKGTIKKYWMEEIEPDGGRKCTFSFLGMRHKLKNIFRY
jgi:hypothetical protein